MLISGSFLFTLLHLIASYILKPVPESIHSTLSSRHQKHWKMFFHQSLNFWPAPIHLHAEALRYTVSCTKIQTSALSFSRRIQAKPTELFVLWLNLNLRNTHSSGSFRTVDYTEIHFCIILWHRPILLQSFIYSSLAGKLQVSVGSPPSFSSLKKILPARLRKHARFSISVLHVFHFFEKQDKTSTWLDLEQPFIATSPIPYQYKMLS